MTTSHNDDDASLDLDEFDLDFEPNGSIGELAAELANDDETKSLYLRERWIAQTISTLRHARYDSGKSQRDIAEALGTKQPAIARLERSGDITLGRIWDYLHACGKTPLPIAITDAGDEAKFPEGDIRLLHERQRRAG
jgi:hypothetical protein